MKLARLLAVMLSSGCALGASESESEPPLQQEADLAGTKCAQPAALPSQLAGGMISAVGVQDLDGDVCPDVVYFDVTTPAASKPRLELVVAWGRTSQATPQTYARAVVSTLNLPSDYSTRTIMRDQSTHLFVASAPGAGARPLFTSVGRLQASSNRKLTLEPYAAVPWHGRILPPIVSIDASTILRAGSIGGLERCDRTTLRCVAMLRDGSAQRTAYADAITGDFDGDGKLDIVAGRLDEGIAPSGAIIQSYLWSSKDNYRTPTTVPGLEARQLVAADLNRDGLADIVALEGETISDFPSSTTIALGTRSGAPRAQRAYLGNFDNHADPPALVDADGDGAPDLIQCGVDQGVAVLWGTRAGLPRAPQDARFESVSTTTSVGVQAIDLNGDGKLELVVRRADVSVGGAHVLPLPRRSR